MSSTPRIKPKRVIGSVLLLGGVAYLPAVCAEADPYVSPARDQMVVAQVTSSPNTNKQILPQAAPAIPGAADTKVEGPESFSVNLSGATDGATISMQNGTVAKHMHPNTNEIQYVLEGSGTIWLGDKQVQVKAGDLIVIPKGTAHGGATTAMKAVAIKTPPQAPDDTKMLN